MTAPTLDRVDAQIRDFFDDKTAKFPEIAMPQTPDYSGEGYTTEEYREAFEFKLTD